MSVFDGSMWSANVWESSLWAKDVWYNPIVDLFARLNGTGVAVDPLTAAKVFSDTAGTTPATIGGTVARVDSIADGVAASFTNAMAGQRPLLRADGLDFDGVDDALSYPDDQALRFGLTDFTIAFACKPDTLPTAAGIWSKRGSGSVKGWGLRQNGSTLILEFTSDNVVAFPTWSGVFAAGTPMYGLIKINRTTATAELMVGGVSKGSFPIDTGDIGGTQPLTIGKAPNQAWFFDGTIGRLLAINKLLNPTDTATVEQWLQNLI